MGRRVDYSASYAAYDQLRLVQETDEDADKDEESKKIKITSLVKEELKIEDQVEQ